MFGVGRILHFLIEVAIMTSKINLMYWGRSILKRHKAMHRERQKHLEFMYLLGKVVRGRERDEYHSRNEESKKASHMADEV